MKDFDLQKLNSEQHGELKVMPMLSMAAKNHVHLLHVFPQEIPMLSRELPIFFIKDEYTGQFTLVTLMGLAVDENLLIVDERWQGNYLPLKFQSQPFYLLPDTEQQQPAIFIDLADQRVQPHHGDAIFEHGMATSYLKYIANMLADITKGYAQSEQLINAMLAVELIEPVTLDIVHKTQQCSIAGLYTVNKQQLAQLKSAQTIAQTIRQQLPLIEKIAASTDQLKRLVALKEQQVQMT